MTEVPPARILPPKTAPLFFGGAKHDFLCVAENGYTVFRSETFGEHDVTIREFDADHWIILSKADEVCREVESWIEGTVNKVNQ